MEDFLYADYDYEPDAEDVEYLDYYDDEIYEIPGSEARWEEEDIIPPQYTVTELYEYCVIPTLTDSVRHLSNLIMWSLIFTLTSRTVKLPGWVIHIVSSVCGSMVVWQFFGLRSAYMAGLSATGLTTLLLAHLILKRRRGPATCIACVVFLIACEVWLADPQDWHSVRGALMIILMKIVSVGYDLDSLILTSFPNPLELIGYVLCPGTTIFGPWVTLLNYRKVSEPLKWNIWWIIGIGEKMLVSIFFLLVSTCFCSWIVPDNASKWALAYREAFSFRASHYFVSYFSEASTNLVGLEVAGVARPYFIEIPRSLVEVVVYWNMPMHNWLKVYVFKTARGLMGTLLALLLTYSMSSLFHGLNFQLGAVLLSLGIYTYTEHSLRQKLADFFSACILARPCQQDCQHNYQGHSWLTMSTNLFFGLLAMFHLAYLGVMFDSSSSQQETGYSMEHTLAKWAGLDYASHIVMFAMYIINGIL